MIKDNLLTLKKETLKSKNQDHKTALTALSALIKQYEVDTRTEITADQEIQIVKKMIKQRHESAKMYAENGRPELCNAENAEIEYLEQFLPKQLTESEISLEIGLVIEMIDNPTMKDMGIIMGKLSHLKSTADMKNVNKMVRVALSQ